ncbi:MAG TPA: UDP-3-O-acyl-N-acetylglucosamine deacetylase [Candidatus Paceibacterota bacterium]
MRRYVLNKPITILGRGAFGGNANLTLEPVDKLGIFWNINGMDVPLGKTRIVAHPRLHYLALLSGKNILRVPEHLLGFLYASGIDGVSTHSKRLPYDGCAQEFYEQVFCSDDLRLKDHFDCYTTNESVGVPAANGRMLEFKPSNNPCTLTYDIEIQYQGIGMYTLCGDLFPEDLEKLASSRPFGRTHLKLLSRLLGRTNQYVWLGEVGSRGLEEIAYHRLLDLLGALIHATPPGGRLVGNIISPPFAGHRTDILLLHELHRVGLRKVD